MFFGFLGSVVSKFVSEIELDNVGLLLISCWVFMMVVWILGVLDFMLVGYLIISFVSLILFSLWFVIVNFWYLGDFMGSEVVKWLLGFI